MPAEKFYSPSIVEGDTVDFAHTQAFIVAWSRGDDAVPDGQVFIAGLGFDESGLTRLIRVLRRAKRQTFPAVGTVEIGGQVMTEEQFNAARYPLIAGDPGPVVA